jgi:hypothetical protein
LGSSTETSFTEGVSALVGFDPFLFGVGRTYEYEQVREWLSGTGVSEISHQGFQMPGMSLVIGRKPRRGASRSG